MTLYIEELVHTLAEAGTRPVLRRAGRDTTASELLAAVHRYARVLDRLGIGRGDLVALLAPNRVDALAVRYAAHLIGAGAVTWWEGSYRSRPRLPDLPMTEARIIPPPEPTPLINTFDVETTASVVPPQEVIRATEPTRRSRR